MPGETAAPVGAAFDFEGESYFLPRVTQEVIDQFEAYACAQALARVRRMAVAQTSEENDQDYDGAMRRVLSGRLGWDEPDGIAFRYTTEGMTLAIWLSLKSRDPKTKLEVVRAMVKKKPAFFFEQYGLANADPTGPPSEISSEGGGSSAPGSASTGG